MNMLAERIPIEGMTCESCVRHVRDALGALPGVEVGKVDRKSAEVRYNPITIHRATILETIREEGYRVPNTGK